MMVRRDRRERLEHKGQEETTLRLLARGGLLEIQDLVGRGGSRVRMESKATWVLLDRQGPTVPRVFQGVAETAARTAKGATVWFRQTGRLLR